MPFQSKSFQFCDCDVMICGCNVEHNIQIELLKLLVLAEDSLSSFMNHRGESELCLLS